MAQRVRELQVLDNEDEQNEPKMNEVEQKGTKTTSELQVIDNENEQNGQKGMKPNKN